MSNASHVFNLRTLALATLLTVAFSAQAQPLPVNVTDLGKTHPNTADISVSPYFHVYMFQRDGIRYIQVNDQQYNVRAAFAVANGVYLALPIGTDARHVSTPLHPLLMTGAVSLSETVYRDSSMQVIMIPQSDGVQWQVQSVPTANMSPTSNSQTEQQETTCTLHTCGGDVIKALSTTPCTLHTCGGDVIQTQSTSQP